jgi:hypothetical protein
MITKHFKIISLFYSGLMFFNLCNAQPCECKSKYAKQHYNEFCKVTGIIIDVVCITNNKVNMIFLNIGNKYPNQDLTVMINEKNLRNFSKPLDVLYLNKTVSIYGVIKSISGKPVIYIKKETDIEIIKP